MVDALCRRVGSDTLRGSFQVLERTAVGPKGGWSPRFKVFERCVFVVFPRLLSCFRIQSTWMGGLGLGVRPAQSEKTRAEDQRTSTPALVAA